MDWLVLETGIAEQHLYRWPSVKPPTWTALVVHGLGDHGRALPYRNLARALSGAGACVISFDHRGHGTRQAVSSPIRLQPMVDELAQTAALVRRSASGPLVLIGLSMGAAMAMLACQANRSMVDALVAVSAPLGEVRAGPAAVLMARWLARWLPNLRVPTGIAVEAITRDAAQLEQYLADDAVHRNIPLGLAADLLAAIPTLRQLAAGIEVPTLYVHGDADRISPLDRAFFAGLRGPSLRVIERGSHNLFLDLDRDAVFADVLGWVERLRAGEQPVERRSLLAERQC